MAKGKSHWVGGNLRFIGTMILLSSAINFLFVHTGQTELFALPKQWLLIGGKFTLESLVYGAVNGLVIGALYILFNIFNLALSIKQITRLIPRAFHSLTLMVTISLTFFPSIQERTRQIREAQLIRGNPMKKVSDWLPVLLPLLVTSMENAVSLSESMTVRGFETTRAKSQSGLGLIGLILALFTLFTGWILQLFDYPNWISWTLYFTSATLIVWVMIAAGKAVHTSRLEQVHWQKSDFIAVALQVISFGFFIWILTSIHSTLLSYTPYPSLSMPKFNPLLFVTSLIPAIPLLFKTHD